MFFSSPGILLQPCDSGQGGPGASGAPLCLPFVLGSTEPRTELGNYFVASKSAMAVASMPCFGSQAQTELGTRRKVVEDEPGIACHIREMIDWGAD